VVGTAINLLALGVTGTLFRAQFGQSGQLLSVPTVPRIGETGLDAVILVTIVAAIAWSWALRVSAWGLVVRAVGEFPKAVEAAGFSVPQLRTQGLAISGLFGGLGGAYLALGIAGSFAENMVAGRGFLAIAMVTFGRWKPVWVLVGTLLIGGAESLQFALQARGVAVPYQLMIALPYVVALVVLVAVGRGVRPPEALGIPYRREA
jgi:simple sugar transport system permease protein